MGLFDSIFGGGSDSEQAQKVNEASWWELQNKGNEAKHNGFTFGDDKPNDVNQSSWDWLKSGENNP